MLDVQTQCGVLRRRFFAALAVWAANVHCGPREGPVGETETTGMSTSAEPTESIDSGEPTTGAASTCPAGSSEREECPYVEDLGSCPTADDPALLRYPDERPFGRWNGCVAEVLELTDAVKCCYVYCAEIGCTPGRPLRTEAGPCEAAAMSRDDWCAPVLVSQPRPPAEGRGTLAAAWVAAGLAEHASVAAFARCTLHLLALGAPPALVAASQRAGLDEVEHARLCFALAATYGAAVGPGPLALTGVDWRTTAVQLAVETLVEGCVGEATAALIASEAARQCDDPQVSLVLRRIAADETRHAELAWAIIGWSLAHDPERSVAQALCQQMTAISRSVIHAPPASTPSLASEGILAPREQALLRAAVIRDVVAPLLEVAVARHRELGPETSVSMA